LIVNEFGGADLDGGLRLHLVRRGVMGQPKSCVSRLRHQLLFGFLQHNDLLLSLLQGTTIRDGRPHLRVQRLALQDL